MMSEPMLLQMWKASPAAFLVLAGMLFSVFSFFMWLFYKSGEQK